MTKIFKRISSSLFFLRVTGFSSDARALCVADRLQKWTSKMENDQNVSFLSLFLHCLFVIYPPYDGP